MADNGNKALDFIEYYWMDLINLLANRDQLENSDGCLRLLTDAGSALHTTYCSDTSTNARKLLFALKNYIKKTKWERERVRCVDVLLLSLNKQEQKNLLCAKWDRWGQSTRKSTFRCTDQVVPEGCSKEETNVSIYLFVL